jgi:AbrB family looped-hinge helix DNA binding protein
MPSVTVSIDRAGRVVIPEDVRDRLALSPDAELEVVVDGDSIRLTPTRPAVLPTRDQGARRTYDLLGVTYELVGP